MGCRWFHGSMVTWTAEYLTRPAANCLLGAALALLARCRSASIACTLPHASPSVHTYHGRSWPSSLWLSERVLQFGKRFLLRSQTNAGTSLRHELGQVRDLCGQVRADCWCALARHIRRPPRVPHRKPPVTPPRRPVGGQYPEHQARSFDKMTLPLAHPSCTAVMKRGCTLSCPTARVIRLLNSVLAPRPC